MTILRKKAGPEFDAMEFDGSFESAKAIIAWAGDDGRAQGAYWSSNQTMTFPNLPRNSTVVRGGWLGMQPDGRLFPVGGGTFGMSFDDFEVVA